MATSDFTKSATTNVAVRINADNTLTYLGTVGDDEDIKTIIDADGSHTKLTNVIQLPVMVFDDTTM